METVEEFIAEYLKMRDQQNKYFKFRLTADLNKAKKMETELDKKCLDYVKKKAQEKLQTQTILFK